MRVSIITPERVVLNCDARQVLVPGTKSPFAMLEQHQAIISSLLPEGEVKITQTDGQKVRVHISGNSIVEQHDNQVSILATRAQLKERE